MPRVTHLQLQRRRTDRVNVYLADEYAFSLNVDLAVRLRVDQDLSDAEIAALRAEDAYRVALDRSFGWLASRPRSRLELTRYLHGKDVPPDVAARVEQRLVELGYLDDEAFARWWVDNRAAHRPRGRPMLRHELATRGVAPEIIAAVTGAVDDDDGALAVALAQAPRHAHLDRAAFQRRLGSFLSRRGFAYGAIRRALDVAWAAAGGGAAAAGDPDDDEPPRYRHDDDHHRDGEANGDED